jgi:phage terminase small subunit
MAAKKRAADISATVSPEGPTASKIRKPRTPKISAAPYSKTDPKALTAKQEKFVTQYLEHGNATRAYREVYDVSKTKPASIEQLACRLLKHVKVRSRIDELKEAARKKAEERYFVSNERLIAELATIAFANPEDYFEWSAEGVTVKPSCELTQRQRAAVSEVSQTITPGGGSIKVKLSDKQAAIDKLLRIQGAYKDNLDLTNNGGSFADIAIVFVDGQTADFEASTVPESV